MRKVLLILLLVLAVVSSGFAQKKPYTAQEFVLREVTMKENSSKQQLNFSFRIFGRYADSELLDEEGKTWSPNYVLRFWLATANGDLLVPPGSDESQLQRFSGFSIDSGAYRSYSFGHTVAFPYKDFMRHGPQTFSLWAQPESPDGRIKLPAFKTGTYSVTIPKLHPITDQQIQIKSVTPGENSYGVKLKYSCQFQYAASELYIENETTDEVLFYAEFTKADGSPVTLSTDPRQQTDKNPVPPSSQHQTKTPVSGEIEVPYAQFFLPQGPQEVNYAIHAMTANGTRRWENLYRGKCTLHMPPVYWARAVVKNIRVAERSYDVAAKDIPFINLFVSNKGSGGKGYPDLFWKFSGEGRTIMTTSISHNTFEGQDDSCFFQMMENERLSLGIYDYDVLSFNDKLGFFTLPVLRGETTYRQTRLRSDDVVDGEITVERKLRPAMPTTSLYVKAGQYEGVSGYKIWGRVTNNNALFKTRFFLRLADGSNQVPTWQQMPVPNDADFAGFIPAWEYPGSAKVGLLVSDKQYQMPMAQQYAQPDKYITESPDVQLQVSQPQTATENGVHGLRLQVTALYPAGVSNKNIFRFLYTLRETGGIDLKPIVEQGHFSGSLLCEGKECAFTVFIPYALLANFSEKTLQAVFGNEIQVAKNRFTVGKNETGISLSVPKLLPTPKAIFSTNLKFKKSWSYVEIASEYNGKKQVLVKERADGGKFTQEITFPTEYVYGQDTLSLIITPYEFRTAQTAIRWNFTADDLLKAGTLKLAKDAQAKKSTLKVY